MSTIGFIGTGVMGRSMAANLLSAGHHLIIYTRTKEKARPLLDAGAKWAECPAKVAEAAGTIFTIVGFPEDVEAIYFGEQGVFSSLFSGKTVIDMTTSSPELAVRIHNQAQDLGCHALDAPVSGGDIGARTGTLSIMVGGDREAYDACLPLLQVIGDNIVYQGPAGSGQHCKMCNQIAIASNMLGVCEALAYAREAGLKPETVLESISAGAAGSWSLSNLAPRMIAGDFDPGFYVKHFIKDMEIAATSAKQLGVDHPGLDLALSLYRQLSVSGFENDGTQALYRLYGDTSPD